jgi:hypothetical protein
MQENDSGADRCSGDMVVVYVRQGDMVLLEQRKHLVSSDLRVEAMRAAMEMDSPHAVAVCKKLAIPHNVYVRHIEAVPAVLNGACDRV